MATLILGGAPGANWFPLLLPLIAVFLLVVFGEYIYKFIKRKLHGHGHKGQ